LCPSRLLICLCTSRKLWIRPLSFWGFTGVRSCLVVS
jgi:hypothetical protein